MHVCHAQCPTRTQAIANGIFAGQRDGDGEKREARLYISNKSTARTLLGLPPTPGRVHRGSFPSSLYVFIIGTRLVIPRSKRA